jgi:hypothetical protein
MLNKHFELIKITFNVKGIQGTLSSLTIEDNERLHKEIKGEIEKVCDNLSFANATLNRLVDIAKGNIDGDRGISHYYIFNYYDYRCWWQR